MAKIKVKKILWKSFECYTAFFQVVKILEFDTENFHIKAEG